MSERGAPEESGLRGLTWRVEGLRSALAVRNPSELARRTGALYVPPGPGGAELRITVWGRQVSIAVPGFGARDAETGKEARIDILALLLYYLHTSDGAAEEGRWVSLAELPDGTFYDAAFQGYSGDVLAREFGNDREAFRRAATRLCGFPEPFGDSAFSFRALPKVALAAVYWGGDDEFSSSAKVLFDASASHHLPTDVCAILGGTLARRLVKAHKAAPGQSPSPQPPP